MKALEEVFVQTTLALLLSLPVQSEKMQLAHWYTQKTKCNLTTEVLRVLVLKTTAVTQTKQLVQLGISYQTLQDIRCTSSTDADFSKALADRSTKPISRETCGADPNLRSRVFLRHATPPFVFVFLLPTGFIILSSCCS